MTPLAILVCIALSAVVSTLEIVLIKVTDEFLEVPDTRKGYFKTWLVSFIFTTIIILIAGHLVVLTI